VALHVRIAITQAAFDVIVSTMILGSVGFENEVNAQGERLIWLDRAVVQRLNHLHDPSESLSDVILRFVAEEYSAAKI
jgi:hypothetical protein